MPNVWKPFEEIPVEGHGLGRQIHRPEGFQDRLITATLTPRTVKYTRHCDPYNQGNLGSCVGNATAGALMTDPFYVPGRIYAEADAVNFYSQATHYNGNGEFYPPNDVGSSGPAVGQALEHDGLISNFSHATDVNTAAGALSITPGIFGVSWYDSMDQPLSTGEVQISPNAQVRGGHEIECFGIDVENKQFWFYQSWGPTWGGLGNGTFWMSFDTMDQQFGQQADATFFVIGNSPSPAPSGLTSSACATVKRWFHLG